MSPQDSGSPVTNAPDLNIFVFPCYWGGVTRSSKPPMIHEKLRDLRMAVGGIAAKRVQGGPSFPVRGAKELAQKLAQALVDLNMVAPVINQEVTLVPTDAIPDNKTASGKPVFRTLAHVKATVRIGAEDGSFVDTVGSGHGGDVDDKAGGKADTYAWKSAILKGLTVPEQDMLDDTDDEEPSKEAPAKATPAPKAASAVDTQRASSESKPTGEASRYEETLLKVAAADGPALDALADQIRSGEIPLSKPDKLKISAAFVKRRKEIESEAPVGN